MLRFFTRAFILIAAVAIAAWGRPDYSLPALVPALSPFLAASSALALRSVDLLTLAAIPALLLSLLIPRGFCRHLCPVGLLHEAVARARPAAKANGMRLPRIGAWAALITLGGAALGYPILAWLDPLALLNSFLNALWSPRDWASAIAGLGLPVILLLGLISPFLWCSRLCPLGALQELLSGAQKWRRLATCEKVVNTEPASLGEAENKSGRLPTCSTFPARRAFLGLAAGALAAPFILAARKKSAPPLRPPGAAAEPQFTGLCVRCGNCVRACPTKIIRPDAGAHGVASFMTPTLRFDDNYCREDCRNCTRVCPSGAIARLSMDAKRCWVIGPARLDLAICLLANGGECTACITRCPYQALTVESPDGGFTSQPAVDLTKCTGCGACEMVCPVRPQRAVRVMAGGTAQ